MGDSYTIQISSDLVNKLARDGQEKKRVKKSKPKKPEVPHKHQTELSSSPAAPKSGSSGAWPAQAPVFFPLLPPSPPAPAAPAIAELEAIRSVLQQSEGVMKKLEQQEANMTQELTQRAKELRDKEFKLPYQKSMPCEAERDACRRCYQENLKQPLKCAQVVRSFDECARRARQQQQQQEVNSKAWPAQL